MINKCFFTFFILVSVVSIAVFSHSAYSKDLANPIVRHTGKPKIMLANVYHEGLDLSDYWVSEKYDGVRALWDGEQFISRGGNVYHAPGWFIKDFPAEQLDGELWISRQSFELLVGTVRRKKPSDDAWRKVKFMVFDVPKHEGIFDERLVYLTQLIESAQIPWLRAVAQTKVKNHDSLMESLDEVTKLGAEGLMLHKGSSFYRGKRTGDLLKVKSFQDAEATVLEHLPGKGKYINSLGALLVAIENGKTFKIGTGFSDQERSNPPKIGSTITYKYQGKTKNGIPRFASFLRVRADAELIK